MYSSRQPKFDSVIQVHLNLTTSRSTMFVQHPCCFVFYQFILKMQFNPTTGRHIFQRGVKTTWGLFTAQRARKSIVSSLQFNHARFTKHMRAGRQLDSFEFKFQTDRTGHVVTYAFFCDDHIVFLNNVLGTTQSMDGRGYWKNSRHSCATGTDRVSNSKRNRNKRRRIGQYSPIIGNGHSNTVVGVAIVPRRTCTSPKGTGDGTGAAGRAVWRVVLRPVIRGDTGSVGL